MTLLDGRLISDDVFRLCASRMHAGRVRRAWDFKITVVVGDTRGGGESGWEESGFTGAQVLRRNVPRVHTRLAQQEAVDVSAN